ncbi:MAG TPA: tail fiber domain-containing protein, partial [Ferruginibacter sp.]|nr:tail fiber domain-containing protein [Ferruginibacter sp.]
ANTFMGAQSGSKVDRGSFNTGIGARALSNANFIFANNTSSYNTALGFEALHRVNTADSNAAVGFRTLATNQTGARNTGIGSAALLFNSSGNNNTAIGTEALAANSTASNNTAIGFMAARSSTTATGILAIGDSAMYNNSASNNLAIGSRALRDNTTGTTNIAIGRNALESNLTCSQNIAIGESALASMNFGSTIFGNNVAIGYRSLLNVNPVALTSSGSQNTAVGVFTGDDMSTGFNNTLLGYLTGNNLTTGGSNTFIGHTTGGTTTGDQNTLIGASVSASAAIDNASALGYNADVTQSNSMVFGNTAVTKWGFGVNTAAANILEFNAAVTTARLTTGGVWTNASDRNLKTNFTSLDGKDLLQRIVQLPLSRWSYIKEGNSITHIGPMAQDFFTLFNTGGDDKTISSIDPAGVALAGIQQLAKENEQLRKELEALKRLVIKQVK